MILEYLSSTPLMYISGAIILGLLVGSFLNVVIYRLPIMMEREWQRESRLILGLESTPDQAEIFNLAHPNSSCPHCHSPIKPWQNIPVFSYLFLKGKCANCASSISIRYPIIEAVTGLLSGVIAWQLGANIAMLAALGFCWALIALTVIDADHKLLPDQITLPLLWSGLLLNSFEIYVPLEDAVWGAIAGYLSLWSVYWAFKILTGKEGMGYGDFKLLAALGAWMGWQSLPLIILLSSLVGAVVGTVFLLLTKQGRNTTIPFGPYLAAAGWIAFLWGDHIIAFYLHVSGIK